MKLLPFRRFDEERERRLLDEAEHELATLTARKRNPWLDAFVLGAKVGLVLGLLRLALR